MATQPKILSEVSGWYEQYLKKKLTIESSSINHFRVALSNLQTNSGNGFDVDLIDAGEGMIQVMPVLTSLSLAHAWEQGGPRIVAIEEPESHLHPKLQTALASYIVKKVRQKDSPIIMLETHSEHLLLSIQLEIVKRGICPENVVLYWVSQLANGESMVDQITFDEDGKFIGNWPPNVFSGDTELARQILTHRLQRVEK